MCRCGCWSWRITSTLANRIGEGLRDAGYAVDVVYGRAFHK